jgi:hypothetical protein
MMPAHNKTLQEAKDRIDGGCVQFKTVQWRLAGAAPDGTFTPMQLSNAVHGRDHSKDKAAFATGDAMMQDLANAARQVLPSSIPNAARQTVQGVLDAVSAPMYGSAALAHPLYAAGAGLAAVPYLGPVNRLANSIINRAAQTPSRC